MSRAVKRDVIAEALKPTLQVCDGAGLTDLVEIGFSEVVVREPFGEHTSAPSRAQASVRTSAKRRQGNGQASH